jgi:uncharacterized protein (TIGR03084 family)
MDETLTDLLAEQDLLDGVVAVLAPDRWDTPSPAAGWLLRDCVAQLGESDETAAAVIAERRFPPATRRTAPAGSDLSGGQLWARALSPGDLLAWWREARAGLTTQLERLDPEDRLPWASGVTMKRRSFITGRIQEYWAHGLDIHEVAGVAPVDTDRLRHVAHLGYITRDFAYRNRGMEPPGTPLYVELTAPSGMTWIWGPADAPDRITGSAGDFCRVVTQRIHYTDTALRAEGEHAAEFLRLAQAFAGPPGMGRAPKQAGNS